MPLRRFCALKSIVQKCASQLVDIESIHGVLAETYGRMLIRKKQEFTQVWMASNAKINTSPVNFKVEGFVTVHTNAERSHRLQARWKGSMRGDGYKVVPYICDRKLKR